MSEQEWRTFLEAGTRTAKVATTRKDGRPHVVPVWFVLDGLDIMFATPADSIKARTLRRDPRVSICVDAETPPHAFVVIEGQARLTTDIRAIRAAYAVIARRYGDSGDVAASGDPYNRGAGLLVRVALGRVLAITYGD